jgi:hypothetical protein
MQIPVFEHQPYAGETTTGQGHTRTETIDLKETIMQSNEKTLPANVQENIEAFKSAKAVFLDWQGKYNDLQAKAQNQTALAEAAEAEAEQHNKALRSMVRDLVRAEAGDKDTVNALTAKQETARSLAAEHRAFAADLLAEAESLKLHGLIAADAYYRARNKAVSDYSDFQLGEILSGIEEQFFRAVGVKSLSYCVAWGRPNGYQDAMDKAIDDAVKYFKTRMVGLKLDNMADANLDMLAMPAKIRPFTARDLEGFNVLDARKKLRKSQESGAA